MTLAWMFTFGRMADVKELSQSLHFDLFCHCVTNLNTGLRPPSAYSAVVRLLTIAAFLVYPALGRVGYCFGAMCVFTRKCNNWKSTDQKAVTAPAAIGLKSGQAPASTPKMSLSPHRETDRSRIGVNRVRFSNFDRLCSQSVNNVCKLLQLLDDFAIPIGALPVDPMGDFRNLVRMCVMVSPNSDYIWVIFYVVFRAWEKIVYNLTTTDSILMEL